MRTTHAAAPRFDFTVEHRARCQLEDGLELVPLNVSKGHLCALLRERLNPPAPGTQLRNLQLSVAGRDIVLPCLRVLSLREHEQGVQLVLSACDCATTEHPAVGSELPAAHARSPTAHREAETAKAHRG